MAPMAPPLATPLAVGKSWLDDSLAVPPDMHREIGRFATSSLIPAAIMAQHYYIIIMGLSSICLLMDGHYVNAR